MDKLLLRPEEVGHALGVGRSKAYQLIADGSLPSVRIGHSVRVPAEALRSYVHEMAEASRSVQGRRQR